MNVEFFKHNLGATELRSVKKVMNSLFLTTGETVDEFEKRLSDYSGANAAVGLTSCTGALHLALLAADIGAGDEVITTPMSFVATASAICMAGARPVFVDVEKKTGNIDADLIERAITKKTKAILPVHLYGQMADMKRIFSIARKHKLIVIEDAAHALEAERDGIRPAGEYSFGACLSFYATKSITSGEGGAFITGNSRFANAARQLRSHGITNEIAQRHRVGLKKYDIDRLGWKYNMSNIQAAFLIPQMEKIEKRWRRRALIAERYYRAFSKLNIDMPSVIPNSKHAHHLFPIWVSDGKRDKTMDYLKNKGIGTTINYQPIHLFSFFRQNFNLKPGMFPIAENIGRRTISLPLYSQLTTKQIDYVIEQVANAVK